MRVSQGASIVSQLEQINKLVCINLLEAVWLEQANEHKDNSEVGRMLATHPIVKATASDSFVEMETASGSWNDLYIAWNMHVVNCKLLLMDTVLMEKV